MANKKAIRPLDAVLKNYFEGSNQSGSGLNTYYKVLGIKKIWRDVTGDIIARISFPFKISSKVLYVALFDNVWMAEMPYIKPKIIQKLAEHEIEIIDIKFMLSKIKKDEPVKSEVLPEISEIHKQLAEKICSNIENSKVKDAFYNLLTVYLRKNRLY